MNAELKDFRKYAKISAFIFASCLTIGWASDNYLHLSGTTLIMITSAYAFTTRYALLKITKFNKEYANKEIITIPKEAIINQK